MAFVVVTSLLGILDHQLLQSHYPPILDNTKIAESLYNKLRFVQAILSGKNSVSEELEAKISGVAVEAESEIESQLREVYLADHISGDSIAEARVGLHQTLEKVLKDIESLEGNIQNEMESSCEDEVIGCEDEYEKIKGMIIDLQSNKQLEAIAITGIGGIGKTTLAKRVYEDASIMRYFDIRAWAVVSPEYKVKEILIRLLHCIHPKNTEIYSESCDKLKDRLRKSLLGEKYLLVIDDIWSCKAWDKIQLCFPDSENGSRILITTQNREVSKAATGSSKYIHFSRSLNKKESWNLFETKVFGRGHKWETKLKLIGESIVQECQGLPLAIVVIAQLLAAVDKSLQVWQDVLENVMRSFDNNNKLLQMVTSSYTHLPSYLKACLLYLGIFPKGNDIPVNKLINLWVAEGFLKEEKYKSLEEVAKSSLHILISRNLVQVSKQNLDGEIKLCKLNDMLYKFCRKEAYRKNLFCWASTDCTTHRWIRCNSFDWPTSNKIHSILYYFGKDVHLEKNQLVFSGVKMLRVLDLSLIKCWYALPREIEDLVHLRYLALSTLGSLANFQLIKLRNLQTLIVCSWSERCCLQLSGDILELSRLRHVHIGKRYSLYLPRRVQENLQTLQWLKVNRDSKTTDFTTVPKLKELWVLIDDELPPNAFDSLLNLHLLEKLKFEMPSANCFYLPTTLPVNLKKLTLSRTLLQWEAMDIIGRLPNLKVLKLKNFAFKGLEWKLDDSCIFKQLKVFLIVHSYLKCWKATAGNFPVLECLILKFCRELKELPTDVANNCSLRLIELDSCHPSLMKSAMKVQNEEEYFVNNALVIRDLGDKIALPNDESSEEENESCKHGNEDSMEVDENSNDFMDE